jgi:hypothetical protein
MFLAFCCPAGRAPHPLVFRPGGVFHARNRHVPWFGCLFLGARRAVEVLAILFIPARRVFRALKLARTLPELGLGYSRSARRAERECFASCLSLPGFCSEIQHGLFAPSMNNGPGDAMPIPFTRTTTQVRMHKQLLSFVKQKCSRIISLIAYAN